MISDNNSMADGRATMKKKFCTLLKLKLVLIQTILLAINILMVTPRATTKKKTGLVINLAMICCQTSIRYLQGTYLELTLFLQ